MAAAALMPRALTWLDDVAARWEASGGPEADATAADALSLVAALVGQCRLTL